MSVSIRSSFGFASLDIVSFNSKCNVLGSDKTIISFCQLISEHLGKLHTQIIKTVILLFNTDHIFIFRHVAVMIDKGQLKMDGTVKIIQEITPVLKNRIFILILC